MATGNPDTVEQWAPHFLYFVGTNTTKFTKEQVLDPKLSITSGHCKLCDAPVPKGETNEEHMRAHRKELTVWLGRKRKQAEANSKKGLALARREKQMLAAAEEARAIIQQVNEEE